MSGGSVFGVALNTRAEVGRLAAAFAQPPYGRPPSAPVLYMKSRNCLLPSSGEVVLDPDLAQVEIGATMGLILGREASHETPHTALSAVASAALVADLVAPGGHYYRPSVRDRCRDGFLPRGTAIGFDADLLTSQIVTRIDGQVVHCWSLGDLVRDAPTLIADITAFMTLSAGDMLLLGLAADAPRAGPGQSLRVEADGLPSLRFTIATGSAA